MYPTAEVRWFYRGPIPSEVTTWFQRDAGSVEREEPREDHYLRLPDSDGVNVKWREGRIEIKRRIGPVDTVRFHDQVTGIVEQWRKWSFELAGANVDPPFPPSWVPVGKARRMRRYTVKGSGEVVAQTVRQAPPRGCELELTQVRAEEQVWWTLAFEAFGREPALREDLLLVARYVLGADEPPVLQVHRSHGYAAWLDAMTQREEMSSWQD